MRRVVWVLLAAGCSAQAPPSSNAPPPVANATVRVEVPPAESLPPAEPAGLVTLTRPARSVCELKGALAGGVIDLAAMPNAPGFGSVATGEATLSFGEDGHAFAEVVLPSSTVLRGFASQSITPEPLLGIATALVYAKGWLAFGGVYYPGDLQPMRVNGVKDGKIVVTPDGSIRSYFALYESAWAMDVACADISLTSDPRAEFRKRAPSAFLASGKEQFMWLAGLRAVPLSATVDGPASGVFAVTPEEPMRVVLLERRGQRARVRHRRVAGWVDYGLLSAKEPKQAGGQEFGMIGLLNTGASDEAAEGPNTARGRRVSCNSDVRLVVELGAAHVVVGAIPPGQAFVITESEADLGYLSFDGSAVKMTHGARLAVPMRDAMGCADANGGTDALAGLRTQASEQPADSDAVSDLGKEPASKHSAPKVRMGAVTVSGRLPAEVVQRIVRQNYGRFRLCYEQGLAKNPALAGRISARFVIKQDGSVPHVSNGGSSLADQSVTSCVLGSIRGMTFPQPEGGIVTVLCPIEFSAD